MDLVGRCFTRCIRSRVVRCYRGKTEERVRRRRGREGSWYLGVGVLRYSPGLIELVFLVMDERCAGGSSEETLFDRPCEGRERARREEKVPRLITCNMRGDPAGCFSDENVGSSTSPCACFEPSSIDRSGRPAHGRRLGTAGKGFRCPHGESDGLVALLFSTDCVMYSVPRRYAPSATASRQATMASFRPLS